MGKKGELNLSETEKVMKQYTDGTLSKEKIS